MTGTTAGPARRLRPPSLSDVDAAHAIFSDPGTWRHLPEGRLTRREQTTDIVRRDAVDWRAVGLSQWAVLLDDVLVGLGGAMPRDVVDGHVGFWNLGFRLSPNAWGSGLATWVARLGVVAAHAHSPDTPVIARSLTTNPASARVSEKAGLRKVHEGPSVAHEGRVLVVHADRELPAAVLDPVVALG